MPRLMYVTWCCVWKEAHKQVSKLKKEVHFFMLGVSQRLRSGKDMTLNSVVVPLSSHKDARQVYKARRIVRDHEKAFLRTRKQNRICFSSN